MSPSPEFIRRNEEPLSSLSSKGGEDGRRRGILRSHGRRLAGDASHRAVLRRRASR